MSQKEKNKLTSYCGHKSASAAVVHGQQKTSKLTLHAVLGDNGGVLGNADDAGH